MSQNDPDEIRSAAERVVASARRGGGGPGPSAGYNNMPPQYDISRAHPINLFTDEFLGGYMQDGRMSVVRRFFCLFVTFDLIFVALLWLICIMINGDNIFQAFQKQILHYTVYTSLFDVVAAAICRFIILIFFYACLYINHWSVITFSTTGSCVFLVSKVFFFDWVHSKQQVFEVILIITSFVLAWGEAWFLDCRVIPQERHAQRYLRALSTNDRAPLMAPFLASSVNERPPPESVSNFYSLLETAAHSDEEDEEDEEYNLMGLDCLRKAYELFQSTDWKVEKVTAKGDTIYSTQRDKIGKIYKLTGRVKYNAKELIEELFYRIEDVPKWNPSLLESKIVRKINSYTDITYQASVGGGGGMIKSRDFVNLRSFRLFRNGQVCHDEHQSDMSSDDDDGNFSCGGSISTISDGECTPLPGSVGSTRSCQKAETPANHFQTLSKSLGAKGFAAAAPAPAPLVMLDEPPPLDEQFEDAKDQLLDGDESPAKPKVAAAAQTPEQGKTKDKIWISAAISIDYKKVPPTNKYTRGENIVSGFALREIVGKKDACIFEWVLCLDLKGYIPRYVLDAAMTTFMTDYMTYLRKYVNEMRQTRKRVPRN